MLQIQDKKFAKSMFSEFAYLWKCRDNGGFRDMKSNLKFPHQFNMSFTPSHLTGFQMNSQFYIKGHRLFKGEKFNNNFEYHTSNCFYCLELHIVANQSQTL